MEKRRKIKVITIVALVAGLLAITVAFAALSGTLKINGSGKMDPANWDIHFKNVKFVGKSETASTSGTPAPTNNDNGPTIEGLNVTLKQPNDYVTYTADIKNEGDIDASIDVVTPPNLTDRENELFTFEAEYTDVQDKGSKLIEHGDMLRAGETKNITITFRYNDISDASKLPSTPETIELTYSILYVQAFETTTTEAPSNPSSVSSCTEFTKKDTYTSGDVIALCNESTGKSEDFYVLSDNGNTVTALAKYNLLVGYDSDFNTFTPVSQSDPEYGIQSSKTLVDMENMTVSGILKFSETNYWVENDALKSQYGNSYPAFVFDSNSNLWTPVQNYQTYLRNTLRKTSASLSLLNHQQLQNLECNLDEVDGKGECSGFIVENMMFWLGTANNSAIYNFIVNFVGDNLPDSNYSGIRPVITINKSEI